MTTLSMRGSLFDDLWEHLRGDVEQAAFLLVAPPSEDGTIEARNLRLIAPDEFDIQTSFHISLGDSARAELIRRAWETDCCVVEVHSHGEKGRARFSPSDLHGFDDWVPHLWWRLAGRAYGALVTAGDTFDGLVWRESPERPEQLDRIVVDDGRTFRATGLTLGDSRDHGDDAISDDRYSRNEALFGVEGQRRIATTRIGIVGLGGLGSHVGQQTAYVGVADYGLVDGDIVTYSSLNRVIGALEADARDGIHKVDVAQRLIREVHREAHVTVASSWLHAADAKGAIRDVDVIFGCVDNDSARLELTDLASELRVPYIDLASDTGGEDDDLWYGGRVVFSRGDGCLSCLGLLDQEEIRRARMSPDEREVDDRIYGLRREALAGTGPAVVSVNGVVASLAVTEFIAWRTGLREPTQRLTYRGDLASVGRNNDAPAPSCFYCERSRDRGSPDVGA